MAMSFMYGNPWDNPSLLDIIQQKPSQVNHQYDAQSENQYDAQSEKQKREAFQTSRFASTNLPVRQW